MKDQITNISKSKSPISFFNIKLSPEAKFIILGLFYIFIAMNVTLSFKIFDLLTFFCIYFCLQHLLSKPALSKKRYFISFVIIIILIIESLMLISYVFYVLSTIFNFGNQENFRLTRLISLFLFLVYWITIRIKSNPNKISEIIKATFSEYFQLFAVVIFYFFATQIIQRYDFPYGVTLIIINAIILASTNILSKKTSKILEILCLGYLFLALSIFSTSIKRGEFISLANNIAIFIVILNFIGIAIIFLKDRNYAEKTKIILLALLMISFFFSGNDIVRNLYLIASFIIARLMIVNQKLSIVSAGIFFTLLIIALFIISIPLSAGRGGGAGYELMKVFGLDFIILPIIIVYYGIIKKM